MKVLNAVKKIFLCVVICYACQSKEKLVNTRDNSITIYTCSMHPGVKALAPGSCPVCHMPLVLKKNNTSEEEHTLHLSTREINLAHIRMQVMEVRTVHDSRLFMATLSVPDRNRYAISIPINARIDTLWVRERGVFVHKGQPLIAFYSELLNDTKEEYRTAWKRVSEGQSMAEVALKAARRKLLLWGLTTSDIDRIPYESDVLTTRIYSPISGYINEIKVREGDYIYAENPLIYIVNAKTRWAEVSLFTEQMPTLDISTRFSITTPYLSQKGATYLTDKKLFPLIMPNAYTQTLLVSVSNAIKDELFRTGLRVQAQVDNPLRRALYLPMDAIVMTEEGPTAWVQLRESVFQKRNLVLGKKGKDFWEVMQGVSVGEKVVVSGAYLLYSAYQLQNN